MLLRAIGVGTAVGVDDIFKNVEPLAMASDEALARTLPTDIAGILRIVAVHVATPVLACRTRGKLNGSTYDKVDGVVDGRSSPAYYRVDD